jgi:hypothetical protein
MINTSMFYTIYQITNKITGKIYVGMHATCNLDDGYMGSGKRIIASIRKHGEENFIKTILHVFDNETDMRRKESEIVTEQFCLRDDTYNLVEGGKGGFGYINRTGKNLRTGSKLSQESRTLISEKKKGVPSPLKGKPQNWSEQSKASHSTSISKALSGMAKSAVHKKNIAKSMQLRLLDPSKKDAQRQSMLNARLKRSNNISPETVAKISQKMKESWASGKRRRTEHPWHDIQTDINLGMKKKDILKKYNISRFIFDHGALKQHIIRKRP